MAERRLSALEIEALAYSTFATPSEPPRADSGSNDQSSYKAALGRGTSQWLADTILLACAGMAVMYGGVWLHPSVFTPN